jgi:D-arabinose 1-dehydrogenase-like Zn-dependent alcohol dehydrogenase
MIDKTGNGIWPRNVLLAVLGVAGLIVIGCAADTNFTVHSPNGNIVATLMYDEERGALTYRVESENREIISGSPVGIHTDRGDFRSGLELMGNSRQVIDETYSLQDARRAYERLAHGDMFGKLVLTNP